MTVENDETECVVRPLYRERAHLLAVLAGLYPATLAYSDPAEPALPVLTLETPAGQLTWHIKPLDLALFPHVPMVGPGRCPVWDGHSTETKLARLAELAGLISGRIPNHPSS